MFEALSRLKVHREAKLLEEAIESAIQGRYADAAGMFGQSGVLPGQKVLHANHLAYAFYRCALTHQSDLNESRAIGDLVTALQFPGLPHPLRSLIQLRLTVIRKGSRPETRKLDDAIADRFARPASDVELRGEFLRRFGLSSANRSRAVDGVDEISSIGVYRWAGDRNRNEQWSLLIREFKQGDAALPAFFGRILAEHVRAEHMCKTWLREVDYIVPVPAAGRRTAERGMDIVGRTGEHLSSRLRIPIRPDFLKRRENSECSRFVSKSALAAQYSFSQPRADEIEGRTVLLLDDVVNRGYTAGACALQLREFGCTKVVLLVLALAESSLQSRRHSQDGSS